ncbi:MAG: serine hydrolase domain-containing protein [Geminicoccaceae bacterium]
MSTGGLSRARLGRMHDVMAGHVERGAVPGIVTAVGRRGEVHVDAIGVQAARGRDPMRRDTIFRIASMTKPVTAAATMILVEECKLRLDEPVDRLLPELADRKVLRRLGGPLDDTVPANRPITVRDLLTMRMGFGLIMEPSADDPVQKAMSEAGIAPGPNPPALAPDDLMKCFGRLPLLHQPGERWLYHSSFDILGVLIARAAGMRFEDFLTERILAPLGMKDTAFSVPEAKRERLAACYHADIATDALVPCEEGRFAVFPGGSTGLFSTVDDDLAFGRMMLNGGRHGAVRILARPTVEVMTTDQLTPAQKAASPFFPGFWDNRGWGLGVSMITRRDGIAAVPGRYGWDGGYGTSWGSDPREDMVAILMIQRLYDPIVADIIADFWTWPTRRSTTDAGLTKGSNREPGISFSMGARPTTNPARIPTAKITTSQGRCEAPHGERRAPSAPLLTPGDVPLTIRPCRTGLAQPGCQALPKVGPGCRIAAPSFVLGKITRDALNGRANHAGRQCQSAR